MAVTEQPKTFKADIVHIYGLFDPGNSECRYIGMTNNLQRRLREHLTPSCLSKHTHKNIWIKSLLKNDLRPEIGSLEVISFEGWQEEEQWWIGYMKCLGADLTNSTLGGEGTLNDEGRKKQAAKLRGRKIKISDEHRSKIIKRNKCRTIPKQIALFQNRQCLYCHEEFAPKRNDQGYCNKKCTISGWRAGIRSRDFFNGEKRYEYRRQAK